MRHNRTRRRLKRNFSHRKQLLENLVLSLLKYQQIKTTLPKAKEAQRLADRLITLGKEGSLFSRRRAFQILGDRDTTTALFGKIAPRFQDRKGGYTRVLHFGLRKGDNAELALLELTEKEIIEKKVKPSKDKKAKAHPEQHERHEGHKHEAAPEAKKKPETFKETKPKKGFLNNIRQFFRTQKGTSGQ